MPGPPAGVVEPASRGSFAAESDSGISDLVRISKGTRIGWPLRDGPPANNTPIRMDTPVLAEEFEAIVPQSKWSIDELPIEGENEIRIGDTSLRNRTNVAGLSMRQIMASSTDG